uniref:Ribosomal protein L7Ae/L30e/S12e/Gadd45 domain-containing protein n=1 Tax=Trichuris muris TaxID=70415 RepID=A0A5S6R0B4_TRIMR
MAFPRLRLKRSWDFTWPDIDNFVATTFANQLASTLKPFAKKKLKSSVQDERLFSIAKSSFVLGANRVLRELEQGKLCVAIFDREFLKPSGVGQAVASLAISKSVHFAVVQNLSSTVSPKLGFHSLAAFGIRSDFHNSFKDFITYLKASLPCVSISQFGESEKPNYISPMCIRFKGERKDKKIKTTK